jgi:hypothetical protein
LHGGSHGACLETVNSFLLKCRAGLLAELLPGSCSKSSTRFEDDASRPRQSSMPPFHVQRRRRAVFSNCTATSARTHRSGRASRRLKSPCWLNTLLRSAALARKARISAASVSAKLLSCRHTRIEPALQQRQPSLLRRRLSTSVQVRLRRLFQTRLPPWRTFDLLSRRVRGGLTFARTRVLTDCARASASHEWTNVRFDNATRNRIASTEKLPSHRSKPIPAAHTTRPPIFF